MPRHAFVKSGGVDEETKVQYVDAGTTASFDEFHVEGVLKALKEEALYVADEPVKHFTNQKTKEIELPDGSKVELEGERVRFTEALFNPALYEGAPVGFMGVH